MKRKYENILPAQIRSAVEAWREIQKEQHAPADRWLANFFYRYRKKFGSRDKRFISAVIYALFRHKSFLEAWAEKLRRPHDDRLLVLMAAAVEGLIPESELKREISPDFPKFTQHDAFRLLQCLTFPGLEEIKTDEERVALQYSFPPWLVKRWNGFFGAQACRQLLESLQVRPSLVVRINPIKTTRQSLIGKFRAHGFRVDPTKKSHFGIIFAERETLFESEEFKQGLFEIQDEGSQLVCQLMDPKPGEVIWDVCAGGGGKSLLLAAMMQNKGRIIATDIRVKKLDDLKKRASRAGIFNIFPADLTRLDEIREVRKGGIHKILIDAPCSGTGTLRRNPDAKWKLKETDFDTFHRDQVAIIEKSLPYLKAGAKLYYVTCSIDPEENEEVIGEILQKYPDLKKIKFPNMTDDFLRLLPHRDGTDGFFMAGLEKG